jgi:nucleoside-diphosphate-sugar epimerase
MMSELEGDIILLGAGGKIGPSLARMARRAVEISGVARRVIAVSRFSAAQEEASLLADGIETIRCDLLDEAAVMRLPAVRNVIYLAGLKFGSAGRAAETWAMNTWLPGIVCKRFRESRIVAYSTGGVYGHTPVTGGGSRETDLPEPVGEYSMSCLGRERIFEYFSTAFGIPTALIRLFYACEVRYGVLVDIAQKVWAEEPIDLAMGYFNTIWQGDNNAMTLLALAQCGTPATVLNVTGPELLSVREVATEMGRMLGREPRFQGSELATSCLGDTARAQELFGRPRVPAEQVMEWAVEWVRRGNVSHGKPTHFEVRDGRY